MHAQPVKKDSWALVGQDRVIRYLETATVNRQLVSSYLFWGPRHTGKATAARYFAQLLLCSNRREQKRACGKCASCKEVLRGMHPDFHRITDEENSIGIGSIRAVLEQFSFRPTMGTHRVAVIENADRLTKEAANALLKTLEEPPEGAVLILTAETIAQLPATVLSRCQALEFQLVDEATIQHVLEHEGASATEAVLLAKLAQGHPGKALTLLQNPEERESVMEKVQAFVALLAEPSGKRLQSVDALVRPSRERLTQEQFHDLLQTWIELLRDCLVLSMQMPELLIHKSFREKLDQIRQRHTLPQLRTLINDLLSMQQQAFHNANTTLLVENFFLHA